MCCTFLFVNRYILYVSIKSLCQADLEHPQLQNFHHLEKHRDSPSPSSLPLHFMEGFTPLKSKRLDSNHSHISE